MCARQRVGFGSNGARKLIKTGGGAAIKLAFCSFHRRGGLKPLAELLLIKIFCCEALIFRNIAWVDEER